MTTSPRVLHVVESLNKGAVENWLVRMFIHGVNSGYELDWTSYSVEGAGRLDETFREYGGKVIHPTNKLTSKRSFVSELRSHIRDGQFDVLHCHHDLVSAVYLWAARGLPLRKRIVHVHNADEVVPVGGKLKQDLLREPLRRMCWGMADQIVGISEHTLDRFRRGRIRANRDRVHYYGVDGSVFETVDGDRERLRRELGFPADAKIFLFAGRIDPAKNPLFAFQVFEKLAAQDPSVFALFAGTGRLSGQLVSDAESSQFTDRFRYVGWRDDVPNLMAWSDLFILPHVEVPLEGLGLAVVEAQLAGLPILLSHGVADDPILPGSESRKLSLSESINAWATAASELLYSRRRARVEAACALAQSPFDMDFAIRDLHGLHTL